jgi:hypothetical protein
VPHAYNSSYSGGGDGEDRCLRPVEVGGGVVHETPPHAINKKLGTVVCLHPICVEDVNRRLVVQASLEINVRSYL